ncbi:MAG: dihydroneopterin aldolase family protein [Methanobacterium sp.]
MNVDEKYFKVISKRERAIFEGAITMGALFHQFIGTPVSIETVDGIEKAITEAMELQPCINEVKIIINREMLGQIKNEFQYVSLSGDMLDIKVFSEYEGHMAIIRMKFIEELQYPLMYVEDVK